MLWDNGRLTIGRLGNGRINDAHPFPVASINRARVSAADRISITSLLHDNSALVTVHELGYGAMRFPDMRQTQLVIPAINTLAKRLRMAQHR
jgi:hypothetical protein